MMVMRIKNNNDDDDDKIHCIYHLIDCSPVAIYSRFGLIVRHRISPSCPKYTNQNPNEVYGEMFKNQMNCMMMMMRHKQKENKV